jgi:hypothetical protein
MNRILLVLLLTMVSHDAYLKAQQVDTTFNTSLDEGYQIFKLVRVNDSSVAFSGYDAAAIYQDPLLSSWNMFVYNHKTGTLVKDSSSTGSNPDIGHLYSKNGQRFLSYTLTLDSTSPTGFTCQIFEINPHLTQGQIIIRLPYVFVPNYLPPPPNIIDVDTGIYVNLNGSAKTYFYNSSHVLVDSFNFPYPTFIDGRLTPLHIAADGEGIAFYQALPQSFTGGCNPIPFPCNRGIVRKYDHNSVLQSSIVIPHLAPFTGTISGANSSPTRIRSIRNFGAHELIMAGQANTHNLPPYNDLNNFGHRSMSNHLAVFKINKDLDSSSLQLKYIPSQQWPIYINDNTALDLKYKDYIYLIGTKVHDYFPVGPLMPYLSTSETGMVVYCLDSNLNIRWQREIHEPGREKHFIDLVALADSGVALLMHEGDNVAPLGMDARLVVLNKTGNLSTSTRELELAKFKAYPNPANESIAMEIELDGTFTLLDLNGRSIRSIKHEFGTSKMDISDLPNGFYILGFRSAGGMHHFEKIIVAH